MAFRDDLRASVQEYPAVYQKSRPRGIPARWRALAGEPGERPPYTVIGIGLAMLGVYLITPSVKPVTAAEVLRDGPSPAAAWVKPDVDALLSGRECIALARLLENRPIQGEHSYSRDVICEPRRIASGPSDR